LRGVKWKRETGIAEGVEIPRNAALDESYSPAAGMYSYAATLPIMKTVPLPWRRMTGRRARVREIGAKTLVWYWRASFSGLLR